MDDNEEPMVLTANPLDLTLSDVTATAAKLTNVSNKIVGYVLSVVPNYVVKAALIPWKQVVQEVKTMADNGTLWEQLGKLFGLPNKLKG